MLLEGAAYNEWYQAGHRVTDGGDAQFSGRTSENPSPYFYTDPQEVECISSVSCRPVTSRADSPASRQEGGECSSSGRGGRFVKIDIKKEEVKEEEE